MANVTAVSNSPDSDADVPFMSSKDDLYQLVMKTVVRGVADAKRKDAIPTGLMTPDEAIAYIAAAANGLTKAIVLLANSRPETVKAWGKAAYSHMYHYIENDQWGYLAEPTWIETPPIYIPPDDTFLDNLSNWMRNLGPNAAAYNAKDV